MVEQAKRQADVSMAALVCVFVTIVWFTLSWRFGFDLADEGYYWYGAQRILAGEVPMRDFMSYDIGRYYWAAAFMYGLGDTGILAARIAAWSFQGLTVGLGVFLCLWATPAKKTPAYRALLALLVAFTCSLWMFPYYKSFDHGASIAVVGMVVMLLGSIRIRTWIFAGVILGLTALLGRNHGVYGAVAAFFALIFLLAKLEQRSKLLRPAVGFIVGVIVSFSPTFLMMLWVPDFNQVFIESIRALLRSSETNISLPIPWPWNFERRELGWLTWGLRIATGLGFIMILLVPVLAMAALASRRLADFSPAQRLLLAAAMTGIPYAHYAYARADLVHLALAIFPLLLAILALGSWVRAPLLAGIGLLALSAWTLSDSQPLLARQLWQHKFEQVSVGEQSIFTAPSEAQQLAAANAALARYPQAAGSFLAMPNMPSVNAIHKAKIPIWEIYALFSRGADFEQQEIARLIATLPQLILISNHALDGREEFRYRNLHPLIYAWIQKNYVLDPVPVVDPAAAGRATSNFEVYIPKAQLAQ